jgi:hypothetical protein
VADLVAADGAAPGAGAVARRSLVIAAVAVLAASRLADGPIVAVVAALLTAAVLLGALHALAVGDAETRVAGVPIESLFLPAVAAYAGAGVLRLVPLGVGMAVAVLALAVLLDRLLALEARLLAATHGPSDGDRAQVLVAAMVVAFLAFVATAALVPGGLPEPGGAGERALGEPEVSVLAGVDALAAGLLGYRISVLRVAALGAALGSAITYAAVIAIGAAALRATDIPRLVGPALLTLVLFLWDAFHAPPTGRRRDPRWYGQVALLVVLGALVVVWNLGLR